MNTFALMGTKDEQKVCCYELPKMRRHNMDLDLKSTLMSLLSYLLLLVVVVDFFFQSVGRSQWIFNQGYSLVIVSAHLASMIQSALYKLEYQWYGLLNSRINERKRLLYEVKESRFEHDLNYGCVIVAGACQVACLTACIIALFSGFGAMLSIGVIFGVASLVQIIRYRQYLSKAIRAVFKVTVFELGAELGSTVAVVVKRDNGEEVRYPLPPRLSRRLWKKAKVLPSEKMDCSAL